MADTGGGEGQGPQPAPAAIPQDGLRQGTASHPDNLLAASLLPLALVTSLAAAPPLTPVSPEFFNLSRASLGLLACAWASYLRSAVLRSADTTGNLSITHVIVASITLALSPPLTSHLPPGHRAYVSYIIYWMMITFRPIMVLLIKKFPASFSFGEAALISQAVVLSGGAALMKLVTLERWDTRSLALVVARGLTHLQDSLASNQAAAVALVAAWALLVAASVAVVALYNARGWRVTTTTRKIFHAATVVVFVSGLQRCHLLLLASSYAALGLMLGLETLRVTRLVPALSTLLTQKLAPFLDAKDGGRLILTNIYLLAGVSLPLWIHPGEVTPFAAPILPLYCGVISVGVADTAAAVVGSAWGRVRWVAGRGRTVEGSAAALLSSLLTVQLLSQLGGVAVASWPAVLAAAAAVTLTEALSSQVDNLTLPLVMVTVLNMATSAADIGIFGTLRKILGL